ncbi:hypothetical protein [Croceibacterium salegens]|nr:hypothetical protein [Croceibacterium salegens]
MQATTRADRERELETLLAEIKAHPERDMTAERERAAVLQRTLASGQDA